MAKRQRRPVRIIKLDLPLPPPAPHSPHKIRLVKAGHVAKVGLASEATYHISELLGAHLGTTIATAGLLLVLIIHIFIPESQEPPL